VGITDLITLYKNNRPLIPGQFNEVMLALFEHIAGLESLSRKRSQRYFQLLWLKYQQAILANQRAR